MLIKTKSPTPNKPEPIRARSIGKKLVPVRCLQGGELAVHQVNQPPSVGNGVNHKNKDGTLFLGDDGKYLRNVRVDPNGTVVTRIDEPVDLNMPVVEVEGTVSVENTLTVNPVSVSNMPEEIRVQENLHVVQVPREVRVAPISFEGYEQVVLSEPCRIYSIHLTVNGLTWIEIPGFAGEMSTREFKIDLFPLFVQLDELVIRVREWSTVGGCAIYEI